MAGNEAESFVVPLLGALQASIAVLLTILVGVIAAQFGLLTDKSSKEISKICITLFLPALLIKNVGSQMQLDTAYRYVPVIVWSLAYNIVSVIFGFVVTRVFNLPDWSTPAIAFNNTTALPLLLLQSLKASGILDSIDSGSDAVDRAKSFFLMNAMIGNSLTFALGPKLMDGQSEDPPDEINKANSDTDDAIDERLDQEENEAQGVDEETSLLPRHIIKPITHATYATSKRTEKLRIRLPRPLQSALSFLRQFVNPPLIGALIGIVIGLVPPLHTLFFSPQDEGGYFNAWLTSAISNVGDLFAALQVLVVGVKLSNSVVRMKKGEASGKVPWLAMTIVLITRFVLWPLASIAVIYLLATRTGLLASDPLLWFCLMLMPTGPPALKLTALADVNGADEIEKMALAKFLIISYAASPIICFAVVGSLKASQAAI